MMRRDPPQLLGPRDFQHSVLRAYSDTLDSTIESGVLSAFIRPKGSGLSDRPAFCTQDPTRRFRLTTRVDNSGSPYWRFLKSSASGLSGARGSLPSPIRPTILMRLPVSGAQVVTLGIRFDGLVHIIAAGSINPCVSHNLVPLPLN